MLQKIMNLTSVKFQDDSAQAQMQLRGFCPFKIETTNYLLVQELEHRLKTRWLE